MKGEPVNILLVDDQPAKLLTYKAILSELGQNLITANSAREALEVLLRTEVAVVLVDVYMPETDGFELAAMIREHPRYQETAIIFISAVLLTDGDRMRGYAMGGVDYVSVPVIPEVLRAKVKIFVELYQKTHELERLNRELEQRVAERTKELAASTRKLQQSEQLRSIALAAGQMGSWEWDASSDTLFWDHGQHQIFGVDPDDFTPTIEFVGPLIHPDDLESLMETCRSPTPQVPAFQTEFRVCRPNGEIRWCVGAAAASFDEEGKMVRLSGVTEDITERRLSEERQMLLAREVDHRARNVVAVMQSILRITRADTMQEYIAAVDGRIGALSNAHRLLADSRWEGADLHRLAEEEFAPYQGSDTNRVSIEGPAILLSPAMAQTLALTLHELVTNAAKHGALSVSAGSVSLSWRVMPDTIDFDWIEAGGPEVKPPSRRGYGTRVFKAGIEQQLKGTLDFRWLASGLQCKLSIPRSADMAPKIDGTGERAPAMNGTNVMNGANGSTKPILLVEDEPTVSMMLADMLLEFGHTVDGPYSRYSDAMGAARANDLHAGVLDVNVGGEKVYPLAAILAKRNIPFVFVTGYSPDSIDPRFTHIPVLQKPIERQALLAVLAGSQPKHTS